MCPACSRGARGRWPRWVSAGRGLIKSSGSRPFSSPGLPGPSVQPTTPSLSRASVPERCRISDRGGDRRCTKRTDAGNCRQTLAYDVRLVAGSNAGIDTVDPLVKCPELFSKKLDCSACILGDRGIIAHGVQETPHVPNALGLDKPELSQVASDGVSEL